MKNAFTMIELIFVIVILGILTGIALPKFVNMEDLTEVSKCEALVGTLNRTISHSIWSEALTSAVNLSTSVTKERIEHFIDIPNRCGNAQEYADATTGTPFTVDIGNITYNITAVAPDKEGPAKWKWSK